MRAYIVKCTSEDVRIVNFPEIDESEISSFLQNQNNLCTGFVDYDKAVEFMEEKIRKINLEMQKKVFCMQDCIKRNSSYIELMKEDIIPQK